MNRLVMPIVLLLTLLTFPIVQVIRTSGGENPYGQEITGNQDVAVAASGGTIC